MRVRMDFQAWNRPEEMGHTQLDSSTPRPEVFAYQAHSDRVVTRSRPTCPISTASLRSEVVGRAGQGGGVGVTSAPLRGPATLHAAEAPRHGVVEFTDGRHGSRTISLPIRAALPVLAKARADEAAHPSVTLLAAASLLSRRFVAAGKFEPGDGAWRLAPLDPDDNERLRRLAESRA